MLGQAGIGLLLCILVSLYPYIMFSDPLSILDSLGVNKGMTVGDFGAGEGAYARELAKRVEKDGAVYAFDVQKDLVTRLAAQAKTAKTENLHAIWADLDEPKSTTLLDASLDAAIVANVLFQSENREAFIKEATRVLRDNGRLLIVDWSDSFGHLGPHPEQVITKDAARRLGEGAGLVFDREIAAGEHHYGLLFRKTKNNL